jgi:thioredoxin-like negative regulator of GroEL
MNVAPNKYAAAWAAVKTAVDAGDVEETFEALAKWLEVDRDHQADGLVVGCLQSAIENCRHAGMDYYVSTK